ncbi:TonB-dependent receptor [Hyphococcus luteus]|uniref:TonB-dependent receptor n=1 Tax=Hyphococcus luteus TaxID=2058213 RepID=A0A2S7K0B0_9PROT|nr:TonB-dependent receptor [Marinicaulis flavus]PQA85955.1 TonB-dependent receptor [Marinicaulis flavus]
MKPSLLLSASLAGALAHGAAAYAQTSSSALEDVIVVTGKSRSRMTVNETAPDFTPDAGPDAAGIIARLPGAAAIDNGALSGQVQYRGLYGDRLNIRVDGQNFASGGPNMMDPPLHYAPAPLVGLIVVDRGVSPVRNGPGLAGGVNAEFKRIDFTDSSEARLGYDVTALGRTVGESYAVGGVAGASNETYRVNILGSYEKGDDVQFPGGVIGSSSHKRAVYGASAGVKLGDQEFGIDLRRQKTGPTGNPPFPMDIRFFETDFARATWNGDLGGIKIESAFSIADVDHAMNNFDLRPTPPDPMRYRETLAAARTLHGKLAFVVPAAGGDLRLGVDMEDADKDVTITNPNNANFFINSLPDVQMQRKGVFAEWTGASGWLNAELGVRADRHDASAGEASLGPALPMMPAMLANAFNAADRNWEKTTVDGVMRLWTEEAHGVSWRFTLARKARAPGYVERFSWLPTPASGGLADGNVYVGDLGLKAETAWITEAGADLRGERFYLRPTVFYRRIDYYVQGVPLDDTVGVIDTPQEMVASMNGDATPLRFANVDAELYGVDMDGGVVLTDHFRLDGVVSYVRGKRRDIDDNLYRIAPPHASLAATYEQAIWSVSAETVLIADQNKVSATNSEQATDGYALLNLTGEIDLADGVSLSAGVTNLFDKDYRQHLAGYNRVAGSDVAIGERIPGNGRGAFVRIHMTR